MARRRDRHRVRALTSGLALAGLLALTLPAAPAVAVAWPTHRCGSFRLHQPPSYNFRVVVLNRRVSCGSATGIVKAFLYGTPVHHGGPDNARSWWTLRSFPGWTCGTGAGGGMCIKHASAAAWELF